MFRRVTSAARNLFFLLGLLLVSISTHGAEAICAEVVIEIKQELTLERQAFEATLKVNNPLTRAIDGVNAFEILCAANTTADCPNPMLILLDLNMPRIGGLEFLKRLNEDPLLKGLPVVIMTSSERNEDICKAHEFDIRGYVLKSDMETGLKEIFSEIGFHRELAMAA